MSKQVWEAQVSMITPEDLDALEIEEQLEHMSQKMTKGQIEDIEFGDVKKLGIIEEEE